MAGSTSAPLSQFKPSLESRLMQVLEGYLSDLERGVPPRPDELLAMYPELAERLQPCLASLDILRQAGSSLGGGRSLDAVHGAPGAAHDPALGAPLGDFRLLREIGRGGMGIVYEAEQTSLARRVALKLLPFAAALDAKALARFKNEALAAAQLDHPHIVDVFAVGCERGMHFYAMRYIDGLSLAQVIEQLGRPRTTPSSRAADESKSCADAKASTQPSSVAEGSLAEGSLVAGETARSPVAETARTDSVLGARTNEEFFDSLARLGVHAAEALHHAHQHGVVHRDVKPANLLLDMEGKVWITDFGLARIETAATLTGPGDLLGTLRYMSPEQALATHAVIDERTDVYSLGATLYELATLLPAFRGSDRRELLRQIAHDEPRPLRKVRHAVPPELEIVILKCLEKSPQDRYASAGELALDLQRFLEHRPIKARRPSVADRLAKWTRRHASLAGAIGVSLLFVLATLSISLVWVLRARDEAQASASSERRQRIQAEKNKREANQQRIAAKRQASRANANLEKAEEAIERLLSRVSNDDFFDLPQADPVRKAILEDALALHLDLLDKNPSSELARYRLARGRQKVARLQRLLGKFPEAKASYLAAIDDLEKIVRDYPSQPKYQQTLARSHGSLGIAVLQRTNQPQEAEEHTRIALDLAEDLARKHPNVREYLDDVADQAGNLAGVLGSQQRPAEAEPFQRRAAELRPNEPASRAQLAFILAQIPNRLGDALDEFAKARQQYADLQLPMPPDTRLQFAFILAQNGRQDDAIDDLRGVIADYEKLALENPQNPEWPESVAGVSFNLAMLLRAKGQHQAAAESCRRAVEGYEALVAGHPDTFQYLDGLARALQMLRACLKAGAEATDLEPILRRLVEVDGRRATQSNNTINPRFELAQDHHFLAEFMAGKNQLDGALAEFEASAQQARELLTLPEKAAASHDLLAATLTRIGTIQCGRGLREQASQAFDEAIEHGRQATSLRAAHPPYLKNLILAYSGCTDWLVRVGDHARASQIANDWWATLGTDATQAIPCLIVLDQCLALAPHDPALSPELQQAAAAKYRASAIAIRDDGLTRLPDVPQALNHAAWLLAVQVEPELAAPALAVELAQRGVRLAPTDGALRNTLGVAYYRQGDWRRCLDELHQSIELAGGNAIDYLVLAMAHWQLGDQQAAHDAYAKGVANLAGDGQSEPDPDAIRLRDEAAELLKIDDAAATQPPTAEATRTTD